MSRSFDVLVLGGEPDALVSAIQLAVAGRKVLLLEPNAELGGVHREIEFAPGFRAAPLSPDLGYLDPEAFRSLGALPSGSIESDPTVIAPNQGAPLLLQRSVEGTAAGLKRFSDRDAARWPKFVEQVGALSGFLGSLYRESAPRFDADTVGEFFTLFKLGRQYRGLGRTGMIELLRSLPISAADWLDDTFESESLKGALAALAVTDLCQGPMSGGTALAFLHQHVGAAPGVIGERLRLKEGPGALIQALTQRARAVGVTIETGSSIRRVVVREGTIESAEPESGEAIACRGIISSLDPYHSLIGLVDQAHLDPVFTQAVRNVRFRGVTTKILVALDALPESVSRLARNAPAGLGTIVIAPSVRYVERAYDATKYGQSSADPVIQIHVPSLGQSNLAPAAKHVAVVHVQYTPYRLRQGQWNELREVGADRAFQVIEEHLPGFTARVKARTVLTPVDLETRFGLREGAVSRGELALDQLLFMRPTPDVARNEGPIAGLYLCGAGAHPGPGILGASGRMAARAMLEHLR